MGTSQLGFLDHPDPDYWKRKPYGFYSEDAWTPGELLAIDAVMMASIGDVGGYYNSWMFGKHNYDITRYSVKRATWESDQWWSYDLSELLNTLWLDGVRVVSDVPEDAVVITTDDLWNHGDGWGDYYREKGKGEFDEYYGRMTCIWLVERPYIRCLIYTYDENISTSSKCWSNVRYLHPTKRGA